MYMYKCVVISVCDSLSLSLSLSFSFSPRVDISCLKLPPLRGVTSHLWLLILILGLPFPSFVLSLSMFMLYCFLVKLTHFCCSLSPCWCQLPEAPTLGWRDESLMASDFNVCVPSPHQYLCVVLSLFFSSLFAFCYLFSRSLLTSVAHPQVAWGVVNGFWFWDQISTFAFCLRSLFNLR